MIENVQRRTTLPEFEDRTFTRPLEHISITEREAEKVLSALLETRVKARD